MFVHTKFNSKYSKDKISLRWLRHPSSLHLDKNCPSLFLIIRRKIEFRSFYFLIEIQRGQADAYISFPRFAFPRHVTYYHSPRDDFIQSKLAYVLKTELEGAVSSTLQS